jgi:iron complex transport system ATP-binding protein
VIDVADLVVDLGDERVLDGVSTTVSDGEFVGLVGPNGAGKTTLLRTINGALTPTAGRVHVAGEDVHDLSSRAASRLVATVPQTTSLSFDFSVREAVEMGRTPHRSRFSTWQPDDATAVERAMARTEVEELADRAVTEISGGERQRVLIARALAQETPLVLLDEPTASLDINHQVRTLELVRALVGEGKTAVAAIHDLNLAAHYCDRLVLLAERAVVAAGTPEHVLTESRLRDAFGANAVVSRHPVTGSVYVTALPEPSGDAVGRVHVVGGGGSAARVLYLLSAAGYTVTVGALNEGDTDTETARHLGFDVVTVPPYAGIDEATRETVAERVAAADAVVVTDVEVSDGNLPNLAAAAAADEIVVVEQRPFEERNFAGRRGTDAYDRLRRDGTVVGQRGVLGAVEAAVSDGTGATTDRTGDGTGADDAVADDRPATGGDGRFPSPPPSRYSSSSSES